MKNQTKADLSNRVRTQKHQWIVCFQERGEGGALRFHPLHQAPTQLPAPKPALCHRLPVTPPTVRTG